MSKLSVNSFDNTKGALGGNRVKSITSYQSFEFLEKGTKMRQSYGIGAGMFEPYSVNWLFESNIKVLKPFESCKEIQCTSHHGQRKRIDQQLCMLIFCNDTQFFQTFNSIAELDDHMTQYVHSKVNV